MEELKDIPEVVNVCFYNRLLFLNANIWAGVLFGNNLDYTASFTSLAYNTTPL